MVREFRFAQLSTITFLSSLVSGIIAIVMALTGFGIWSLVGQRVSMMATKAALLWWRNPWRPTKEKAGSLREMAPYSLRLMTTDLITALYNNVAQLFIGKIYSGTQLGYFNQAQKLKDMPVNSTMQSIQSVTFPALAKIGGDEKKFSESYRSVVMVTAYVMFPMMAGLIATAEEIYTLLLKPDWHPAIPYFRVLCIVGFFYPIAAISYNILKVKSNGSIILRLEIIKKVIMTLVLCLTIPHSVMAVAWGLGIAAACEMLLNMIPSLRYTTLTLWRIVKSIAPIILLTAAMYVTVMLAGEYAAEWSTGARLATKIVVGVVAYGIGGLLFRLESFRTAIDVAKGSLSSRKG
jgi:O-antigen/teichoic acid export membrane protein